MSNDPRPGTADAIELPETEKQKRQNFPPELQSWIQTIPIAQCELTYISHTV